MQPPTLTPMPMPMPSDGLPLIDLAGLRTLADVLGPDRMARMAENFFVDAERRMTLLERDDARPSDLQEHAHALISMAGHLGLSRLSTLCIDLQERARRNDGLDARPALRRAIGEAQAAVEAAIAAGMLRDSHCGGNVTVIPPAGVRSGGRERTIGSAHATAG